MIIKFFGPDINLDVPMIQHYPGISQAATNHTISLT